MADATLRIATPPRPAATPATQVRIETDNLTAK